MGPEMYSGSLPDKSAKAARGNPQLASGLRSTTQAGVED